MAALAITAPAMAQACNNLTRTVAVAAGISGHAEETCGQFTISVAGQSVSGPAKCTIGYAQYMGTVYACGPTAPDLHCKPRGNKVIVHNYAGGGCPNLAGLNPGTWGSWSSFDGQANLLLRARYRASPPIDSDAQYL
jgi:hypothetical protein